MTDRPLKALIGENFKWPYLRKGSSDPLHVWFYGGVFGTAARMALFPVSPNPRWRPIQDGGSAADHPISAADHPI